MKITHSNERSISFKKEANKTSIKHNNRDFKQADWNMQYHEHIDEERSKENVYIIQKDIHDVYDELFGEAIDEYNAKQKRKDRKIDNYFNHVKNSKTLNLQQEFLIQIGDINDYIADEFKNNLPRNEDGKLDYKKIFSCETDVVKENKRIANKILKEYIKGFEERNPNLKIYNAVIHNDEISPHMHINVVPVATGYKKGVNIQPSFNKALEQQNLSGDTSLDIFKSFRQQELSAIEDIMHNYNLERKYVGTNEIKDIHEYKKVMSEVSEMRSKIQKQELEYKSLSDEYNALETKIEAKKVQSAELDDEIQVKQEYLSQIKTTWFNNTKLENMSDDEHLEHAKEFLPNRFGTNRLEIAKKINYLQNFVSAEKASHRNFAKLDQYINQRVTRIVNEKTHKLTNENESLKHENQNLNQENERLKREIKRKNIQEKMNQDEIKGLKKTIRVLENSAKEFMEKTSNRFKHVYFSILGRLSFDKGINPKIFSPTSKSDVEAFNDGWNKAKQKRQMTRERDNGLEL